MVCGSVSRRTAVADLKSALAQIPHVKLVIIDPIFKFVSVRTADDYIEVGNAMEQLMDLARQSNIRILTVRHMKKRESDDITDGALGSTAITGGVDTFIALKAAKDGGRTISTRQRYGTELVETQLKWDKETRSLSMGTHATFHRRR